MTDSLWIAFSVIVLAAIICGLYIVRQRLAASPWTDKALLERGMELPPLWLYFDNSQVNSRLWYDFQARSSRVLNQPYLNLCYESIVRANGKFYRIEVINGIHGLNERLGPDALPPRLAGEQGALMTVGPAEKNWIRAAILAKYGGLWMEPTSIALRGFGELPKDKIVFFGTDPEASFAGKAGTAVPSFQAIWCPKPNNPLFMAWATEAKKRLSEAVSGGSQVRGDAKWDFLKYFDGNPDVEVRPECELRRKGRAGRLIQLEDYLAQGPIHFTVPQTAIYASLPARDLELRLNWQWFRRMSEEQILDSDLVIAQLFKMSLSTF